MEETVKLNPRKLVCCQSFFFFFLLHDCAALIDHQVFQDDKPPVVGVTPLEEGEPGVLFNRVKTAS